MPNECICTPSGIIQSMDSIPEQGTRYPVARGNRLERVDSPGSGSWITLGTVNYCKYIVEVTTNAIATLYCCHRLTAYCLASEKVDTCSVCCAVNACSTSTAE